MYTDILGFTVTKHPSVLFGAGFMFHHHSAPSGNKGFRHLVNGLYSHDSNIMQCPLGSTSYLQQLGGRQVWSLIRILTKNTHTQSIAEVRTLAGIVSREEIIYQTNRLGSKLVISIHGTKD